MGPTRWLWMLGLVGLAGCWLPTEKDILERERYEVNLLRWAQRQALLHRAQQRAWETRLLTESGVAEAVAAIEPDRVKTEIGDRPVVRFRLWVRGGPPGSVAPDAPKVRAQIDRIEESVGCLQEMGISVAGIDSRMQLAMGDPSHWLSAVVHRSCREAGLELVVIEEVVTHLDQWVISGQLRHPTAQSWREMWQENPRPVEP